MSEQQPGAPGIEVDRVHRAFGPVVAVDEMTFTAPSWSVTALVGPNGSGKTTLMLMLASLLEPDRGWVRIDGFDPVTHPLEVRRRIGWMPDGFGTWDALTVREVLHTIGSAYRMPKAQVAERTDIVLEQCFLTDLADRRARVLSRGQKQRLGLARALLHDPSVLVLDEPASGLDPRSRIELRDLLRRAAAEGRTVLVSSHILSELEEVADRVVIVADGRTISEGPIEQTGRDAGVRVRINALDEGALRATLARRGVRFEESGRLVEVHVGGQEQAASLLHDLVTDGVQVTGFAPVHTALEAAYLDATQDRR